MGRQVRINNLRITYLAKWEELDAAGEVQEFGGTLCEHSIEGEDLHPRLLKRILDVVKMAEEDRKVEGDVQAT